MAEGGLSAWTIAAENALEHNSDVAARSGTADAIRFSHSNFLIATAEWGRMAPATPPIACGDLSEKNQPTQLGALRTTLTSNHYPKELADFHLSIDCALCAAGELLAMADEDLVLVCQLIRHWLRQLTDTCAAVVRMRAQAVKNMFEVTLPALRVATSMSDRHSTASLLKEVLEWSTYHRNGLQDVRGNYLFVLGRAKDLCKCIDLSIDCLHMRSTEDATLLGLHISYLESAFAHVAKVTQLMEDCSDFWLRLHCAELGFNKIKMEAQEARNAILSELSTLRVADICGKLLGMLRNLCTPEILAVSGLTSGTRSPSSNHGVGANAGSGRAELDSVHTNLQTVWGTSC